MLGYMIGVTILALGLLVITAIWVFVSARDSRRERAYWGQAEQLLREGRSVDEIIWIMDGVQINRDQGGTDARS